MIRVLTNQGKQGVPPEFNTVLTTPASFQLLDKYCILPGQEANSSQYDKLNFAKVRKQFIADCSNAVKQGMKSVLLGQKPIAFAGAAVSAPQTSTIAAPRPLTGPAAATATTTPTTIATVAPAAGGALANAALPTSSPADRRTSHGHVTGGTNAALGARKYISGCH
jgi:hypothetical protein